MGRDSLRLLPVRTENRCAEGGGKKNSVHRMTTRTFLAGSAVVHPRLGTPPAGVNLAAKVAMIGCRIDWELVWVIVGAEDF